ncbi:MAG: LysM peptidoglycan-binding domain-containing protein, partial [Mesorhizobium sp.]
DQASAPATQNAAADEPKIAVEAVEIDGGKIFVAGRADPGRKVRAYADDVLLGEAKTSPDGHFLIEAARDIPIGNHTIHVDGLADDGDKVVARAAVPFEREPGESIAAVAPNQA